MSEITQQQGHGPGGGGQWPGPGGQWPWPWPPFPGPPTVLLLVPTSGPVAGGTTFVIVGSDLTGATVTFNGVAVPVTPYGGGAVLIGVTPPGAGNVPVIVTKLPFPPVTIPGGFTYLP